MPSKIEWTDETFNPVTGCTPVSRGCDHCYARRMANRLRGRHGYPKEEPFQVTLHPDRLDEPLHWRKPRRVFVCSMGDLFHESAPFEFVKRVWMVAAECLHHTFLFLTKRPERLQTFTQWMAGHDDISIAEWPRNCWLGVSVEDQKTADERIPLLLQTPAAVRFISAEPLLGEIDLTGYLGPSREALDQVIVGGESGPGARPMHPDWARGLRDQAVGAGVSYFFKQQGEWAPCGPLRKSSSFAGGTCYESASGGTTAGAYLQGANAMMFDGGQIMERVGKHKAGRLLDGRTWDEYPE